MKNELEMSMIGEMNFFLGLKIIQNKEGIFIYQTKYLKDLLKRFGLEGCKRIETPMVTGHKLSSKDETPTVEQKKYISMIGGLQYLTRIRLDIANAIGIVAIFQANPREYHYAVVKRTFRYLKGTSDYGIWYDRGNDFTLCGQEREMIERVPEEEHSFLEEDQFLGLARNKIAYHKVQQKQSMLQQQKIVINSYG